jgi:uncharacterized protein (TIGR02453 family)
MIFFLINKESFFAVVFPEGADMSTGKKNDNPLIKPSPTVFSGFEGFPRECIDFFRELARNNTTTWFDEHKSEYEKYVIKPARLFITDMGDRLHAIVPDINADPRVNRSIFRIYRDTRFSGDKTPYKTHLGIWFWEGAAPRMECSGFYFHLEPERIMLGSGMYRFPENKLDKFRNYVLTNKHGDELSRIVSEITAIGRASLGGVHYKRIPRGYDSSHPNASFLLHDGLWAGMESAIPEELFSSALLDYCLERFIHTLPIHRWLVEFLESTA